MQDGRMARVPGERERERGRREKGRKKKGGRTSIDPASSGATNQPTAVDRARKAGKSRDPTPPPALRGSDLLRPKSSPKVVVQGKKTTLKATKLVEQERNPRGPREWREMKRKEKEGNTHLPRPTTRSQQNSQKKLRVRPES